MTMIFDVAVIGAGAAGMMAASVAGQRGRRVVLIDHAKKLGEKIRISGGGRCNFTNTGTTSQQFVSQNPNFCRSALAAYTPTDFIRLVESYGIRWHEKHKGQLFCDDSSESIIQLLRQECVKGNVTWRMPCAVQGVQKTEHGYELATEQGLIRCAQLVIATGGMALPQVGATDFALRLARQFGLKVIEPRPALVPLTFDGVFWQEFVALSGVSAEVELSVALAPKKKISFLEDLLWTHRGLSGPGILQISSYWNPGEKIHINLAPHLDLQTTFLAAKQGNKQQLGNYLTGLLPKRLVEPWLAATAALDPSLLQKRLADLPDSVLRQLAEALSQWSLVPTGTAGYKKAEVMKGGVDTRELNQKTMATRAHPTLYFIGESVDVTGWLGGYNFQWAWASGVACGRAV
ncbi:NAD(P)/FAD-dependent oxidoreductase [Paenalcaligenes hominis]|uniref:Aminoacetone oxidase family FAD-binding enzyme n=1 Tax=Paenalcaligenes hominis TaxID=643674 RepID=A0ABX0WQM3_9BURK|nr:NAD(P)/FAD-dependent oxidoreductase [Paenalcaligenes hominis]NJB64845.1 hypothetical protein [Paenalcaligenes hominis]GGE58550.1 membrane protein [Paenalcaligenes hominis]